MALNATWKEKKAQKVEEYVGKKNARLGSFYCSLLRVHYLGMASDVLDIH
jgi:hypothetical protein